MYTEVFGVNGMMCVTYFKILKQKKKKTDEHGNVNNLNLDHKHLAVHLATLSTFLFFF